MEKNNMKKFFVLIASLFLAFSLISCNNETSNTTTNTTNNNTANNNVVADNTNTKTEFDSVEEFDTWLQTDLTFELSDEVDIERVTYKNRFWIDIVAHLYTPKWMDKSQKYTAIVVGPPYGWVKEQGPWIYSQEMAKRGYVALAFDPSYNGESSGTPRHTSSPEFFVEDFSAWVDFLWTRGFVDREKIGAIGICGSGWFSLTAAQVDPRIKAVATASMYDISSMTRDWFWYTINDEQRRANLEAVANRRYETFENDYYREERPQTGPAESVPEWINPIMWEFFEYYSMERGYHPNALPWFTDSSTMWFTNFPLLNHLEDISPRPILLIVWENGHSNYYSEEVFAEASEPKELYVVPDARHIDLYDGWANWENYIPFDKIESFFNENL